jgi:hypothetical protein
MTINSSKMGSLCGQLINVAIDTNTDPLTGFLLKSLLDLLKVEQETLDQKVDKLIASYFKSGISYLQDATQVSKERQQKWIEAALAEFRKASTLENGLMAAKAMFAVGVCYIMLIERGLALKWFEQAYQAGQQMESKLIKKSTLSKMDAATIISLPLTTIYGAAWLGYRKYQRNKVRQLVLQLRDFMIFVTNVLHAYQSQLDTLQTAEQRAQNYLFLLSFLSNNGPQIVTPPSASASRSFANVGAVASSVMQRVSSNVSVMPLPSRQVPPQHLQSTAQVAMPVWGCLHFHRGGQVPLTGSRTFVGRFDHQAGSQHDIDLSSAPDAHSVSPMHAMIECAQGRCTITDLRSQNATYVNNLRLIPNYPVTLNNGDVLSFGQVRCTFTHNR